MRDPANLLLAAQSLHAGNENIKYDTVEETTPPKTNIDVPHAGPPLGRPRTNEEIIQDMQLWNPAFIDPEMDVQPDRYKSGRIKPSYKQSRWPYNQMGGERLEEMSTFKDVLPKQEKFMPWVQEDLNKYKDIPFDIPETQKNREIPSKENLPNLYTNQPIPKDYLISPNTGKPISLPDLLKVLEMKKQIERDNAGYSEKGESFEQLQERLYKEQHQM